MPNLTKQDIDALVDGLPKDYSNTSRDVADNWVFVGALRRALYLAAGLTATGERKPERVRCWMYEDGSVGSTPPYRDMCAHTIAGWFYPDTESPDAR